MRDETLDYFIGLSDAELAEYLHTVKMTASKIENLQAARANDKSWARRNAPVVG